VRYDERVGYFELGRGRKVRTLTVNSVKSFAQTLKMMALSQEMIQEQTVARDVLREEYYGLKDRIARGFEMIKDEEDYDRKKYLREFMVKIVDEKNRVGSTLGAVNEILSKYWDHWKNLKDECKEIVGNDRSLWVHFFDIEDKDAWYQDYINSDNWFDGDTDEVEEVPPPILVQNDYLALSREKWHVTSTNRLLSI